MKLTIQTSFIDIISKLLHSGTQVHLYHLQCKGKGSYATHKALDNYYNTIPKIIDGIVETYQGKTKNIVTGYHSYSFTEYEYPIVYLEYIKNNVETYRKTLDFNMDNINSQLQITIDLIESTIYFLTFME